MNKNDFIKEVADSIGETRSATKTVLNAILEEIEIALVNGDSVQFPGFGTFTTVERAARTGHNPATGEALEIPASTGVKFKVGATLKKAVK